MPIIFILTRPDIAADHIAGRLVCGKLQVYKCCHDDLGTYTNYVPGALITAPPGQWR
jgi:hypothetical protein